MVGIFCGVIGVISSIAWLSGWDGGPVNMTIGIIGLFASVFCLFLGFN